MTGKNCFVYTGVNVDGFPVSFVVVSFAKRSLQYIDFSLLKLIKARCKHGLVFS
jgi:hypothetical protein